jgi:hypothetical protein
MRAPIIFAAATAVASASFLEDIKINELITNVPKVSIDYNTTLPCGGCFRSSADNGYCYNANTGICCNTAACALNATAQTPPMICPNSITTFNTTSTYFTDPISPMIAHCPLTKQVATKGTDCGCSVDANTTFNKFCDYTQSWSSTSGTKVFSFKKNSIPYGDSCVYKINTQCGYPVIQSNGTEVDIVVAYSDEQWRGLWNGSIPSLANWTAAKQLSAQEKWVLPNIAKSDFNQTALACNSTSVYIVATNLRTPVVPTPNATLLEARQLQTDNENLINVWAQS